jgi:hypothetical protein
MHWGPRTDSDVTGTHDYRRRYERRRRYQRLESGYLNIWLSEYLVICFLLVSAKQEAVVFNTEGTGKREIAELRSAWAARGVVERPGYPSI